MSFGSRVIFTQGRNRFGAPFASALAGDGFDKAVAALRACALVRREKVIDERDPRRVFDCINMHKLVRKFTIARIESEDDARRTLLEVLAAVFPSTGPYDWPKFRRLESIVHHLVVGETRPPSGSEEIVDSLIEGLLSYQTEAVRYVNGEYR